MFALRFMAFNLSIFAIGREFNYSRRLSVTESGGVILKTDSREPVLAHAPSDIVSKYFHYTTNKETSVRDLFYE